MAGEWSPPAIPVFPPQTGEVSIAKLEAHNNMLRLYFRQLGGTLGAIKADENEIETFNRRYTLVMT